MIPFFAEHDHNHYMPYPAYQRSRWLKMCPYRLLSPLDIVVKDNSWTIGAEQLPEIYSSLKSIILRNLQLEPCSTCYFWVKETKSRKDILKKSISGWLNTARAILYWCYRCPLMCGLVTILNIVNSQYKCVSFECPRIANSSFNAAFAELVCITSLGKFRRNVYS